MASSLRASLLILAALCALAAFPSQASASRDLAPRRRRAGFVVRGRVWCDTCLAGFETPASTYIAGAKVKVECRSKSTGAKTCSFEGETDHTGTYNIAVDDEHEHELCESVLVSSPDAARCGKAVAGRERAPVFLTNNNGVTSNVRLANALGFQKDAPLAACAQIMKMYEEVDDRV
ncbi:pollen-specific protein C13 [Oryza brachyantha]|uniref:pollen-specific protein C13 n=1 Tax=Oryza brachyantha TaxID=4533 RepID=UPI001ADD11DD|nr:pollen-specific protein C13 [Oryza brachyantha]